MHLLKYTNKVDLLSSKPDEFLFFYKNKLIKEFNRLEFQIIDNKNELILKKVIRPATDFGDFSRADSLSIIRVIQISFSSKGEFLKISWIVDLDILVFYSLLTSLSFFFISFLIGVSILIILCVCIFISFIFYIIGYYYIKHFVDNLIKFCIPG